MADDGDQRQRVVANLPTRSAEEVVEQRRAAGGDDDAAADFELAVEQLPIAHRPAWLRMPSAESRRSLSLALAGILIVTLLAVLIRVIPGAASSTGQAVATQAAPIRPPEGPTPLPTIPPGTGWSAAGPANAQALVFVPTPGAPALGYTCGAADTAGQSPKIAVNVSQDGGQSWRQSGGTVPGLACDVTANPADPRDVVVATTPSPLFGLHPPVSLFRSFDGGDTWSPLTVPLSANIAQLVTAYSWAWTGSTFFFAPFIVQGTGNWTRLAVSVARQSLVWVDQNGLFDGAPANASIATLIGTATGLYVVLTLGSQCTQYCSPVMRSSDLGRSWSPFLPTYHGATIQLLEGATSGDGVSLFGALPFDATSSATYLRSTDGGVSWVPLPAMPGHYGAFDLTQAPDGALYAAIWNCCGSSENVPQGIYRMPAGAAQWTYAAVFPGASGGPLDLATDADGHPLALWGGAHSPSADRVQPGLETHAP
jgi:hypothetical protein